MSYSWHVEESMTYAQQIHQPVVEIAIPEITPDLTLVSIVSVNEGTVLSESEEN